MSFSEKTAQGGNVSKDGPTSPENVAPRRKCRAAGDIKGWWGRSGLVGPGATPLRGKLTGQWK